MKPLWFTPEFEKLLDEEVARALEILDQKSVVSEINTLKGSTMSSNLERDAQQAVINLRAHLGLDEGTKPSAPDVVSNYLQVFNFVPKYYVSDSQTETLLFDGKGLKDGMLVLLEDCDARSTIDSSLKWDEDSFARAMLVNRWCTVSEVRVLGGLVSFIATYEDETQRKRTHDLKNGWIVKKKSIHDQRLILKQGVVRRINRVLKDYGLEESLDSELCASNLAMEIFDYLGDAIQTD